MASACWMTSFRTTWVKWVWEPWPYLHFCFLQPKGLFVGISSLKPIQNSLDGTDNNLEKRHFFTQIGGVINLDEACKLRPSTQLIFVSGAPINLDLSLATIYQERFVFGAIYRLTRCEPKTNPQCFRLRRRWSKSEKRSCRKITALLPTRWDEAVGIIHKVPKLAKNI